MNDHDKRRFEDTIIGKLIYSWPAIVGILSVIYVLAKSETILTNLSNASAKSASFQESQIGINVKLQTIIDLHNDRLKELEDWRNSTDYWNKRH